MEETEKKIREQRIIEANQKGLMGLNGKFGIILKNMGEPILSHVGGGGWVGEGAFSYESHTLPYMEDPSMGDRDPYADLTPGPPEHIQSQIPVMDDGEMPEEPVGGGFRENRNYPRDMVSIQKMGWYFYGLSSGIDLEIKYSEDTKELLVRYKGRVVYREVMGELFAYVPHKEWEEKLEWLFKVAKEREKKRSKVEKVVEKAESDKEKKSWIKSLRDRWGI